MVFEGQSVGQEDFQALQIGESELPFESLKNRAKQEDRAARAASSVIVLHPTDFDYKAFKLTKARTEDFLEVHYAGRASSSELPLPASQTDPRRVFIVHGRDSIASKGISDLIRSVGLLPVEWSEAKKATKKPSPYIDEILRAGFAMARATIVLLTPDDEARLKPQFHKQHDKAHETQTTGQARPNVLYEAGWAMGSFPDRTVLVEIGDTRPLSDVGGIHVTRMEDNPESRQDLFDALEAAGCEFSLEGKRDWMSTGKIELTPDLEGATNDE